MNRVSVLIISLLAMMLGLVATSAAWAVEAVDVNADTKVLKLDNVVEFYEGDQDRLQVSTAPGPDGIVRRIEVRARQQGVVPGWFVFALANNTDRQIDRYLVVPHFRLSGSGLLKPDLGARRVYAISTSQGFAPERIADTEADVFRVTLDPGNVVTFVGEQSAKSLTSLTLWQPEAYKDYVNSYTFYRGIVLGIAGLLALFLTILFVVKGAAMFPAAALLAWSVLAYLAIDFGFMGRLFDIPTAHEPIWRAVAEVAFSASILILLFTYLTLHRWHVRYLHASGVWLLFLIVVLGVALYDPSLGAGIARLSMVITSVAGFAVILYLAYTGFDRAIMLIPTWILLLLWLLAAGASVAGLLDNDLVQPALNGGLVLLVLLFCFTIMQHAFSGGILAQGIVSDSERRALAIVGSGDMVWDWDVPRDRMHTSREAEKLLGLKRGALEGPARDWLDLIHPQDKDRFTTMLDAVIEQRRGRVNMDFRLRAEDGHYHWFQLRARPVVGTDGEVVRCVGTLLDTTNQRTAEERMLHDAVHDNLTGLANRELLQDRLTAAMNRTKAEGAARPATLLIDIDNFRHINDNYGLSVGDSILLTVARRLTRLLKVQDSIARFYGDQFAIILLSEQQPERIAVFADSARKVLRAPIVFGERELSLSVSIGIAIHDIQSHATAGDVINDAELALYHAKRMGGDRIEPFRPSLRQQGKLRGPLDKDLQFALERKEFEIVYQPIVSLEDRMIKGFEALSRWHHPQRGLISPAEFIPAAERTGFILPLGLYVMEQAARQLNHWQQSLEGMDQLFMSVNVSSQQLLRHDLINDVKTILSRSSLNTGTLKLELTESLVMENPEYASQVLTRLRQLGAGLSLDDFGTGYSSLSYLQHFPFDTLKIDKSFVTSDKGTSHVILQSIVRLAHDLDLSLVAEGVESERSVEQLSAMGCPLGQGYLFGKPLTADEAEVMLGKQIELARQMQLEMQARRQKAAQEAAARKAEEERQKREEQRRKEIEELERAQAHARAIAAQSLKEPEPATKPQPKADEAKSQEDESLEAMLAESLAFDLEGDETASQPAAGNTSKEAKADQGRPSEDKSVEDKAAAPAHAHLKAAGITAAAERALQTKAAPRPQPQPPVPSQVQSQTPALGQQPKAAPATAVSANGNNGGKPHPAAPAAQARNLSLELEQSLEAAVGSAAQKAVTDMSAAGKAQAVKAKAAETLGSLRDKVSGAKSLFSNPFKKAEGSKKEAEAKAAQTGSKAPAHRDARPVPMPKLAEAHRPGVDAARQAQTQPVQHAAQGAQAPRPVPAQAPAQTVHRPAPHGAPNAVPQGTQPRPAQQTVQSPAQREAQRATQNGPQGAASYPDQPSAPQTGPHAATHAAQQGLQQGAQSSQPAPQAGPIIHAPQGMDEQKAQPHGPRIHAPENGDPQQGRASEGNHHEAHSGDGKAALMGTTTAAQPSVLSLPPLKPQAPVPNGPVIHAPIHSSDGPAATSAPATHAEAQQKPVIPAPVEDDSDEGEFPFNMPDLSNIDQDIASAIQQAMRGTKKSRG